VAGLDFRVVRGRKEKGKNILNEKIYIMPSVGMDPCTPHQNLPLVHSFVNHNRISITYSIYLVSRENIFEGDF